MVVNPSHHPWTPEVTRLLRQRVLTAYSSGDMKITEDALNPFIIGVADDCAHPDEVVEKLVAMPGCRALVYFASRPDTTDPA
jgi:hypothetical protein